MMVTPVESILIIGAGQAGARAVDILRREGFRGQLRMVGDEPHLPYQRPPLSKKYLSGNLDADRLPFRHQSFYDDHRVELTLGIQATKLSCSSKQVTLSSGEDLGYDRLLLCTGALSRKLTCSGSDLPGVHYLRTMADVPKIQSGLKPGARVVIIGGGYIGLETAATARKMGCHVVVLEMADRLMNRVVSSAVSEYFAKEHRKQGVLIVCNTRVVRLEGDDKVEAVVCADGSSYLADLLIVGVGAIANSQLASDAGLKCDNGIVVDQYCCTSDASIYGAGDCTYHPSLRFDMQVRLESVDNAFEQARTAALNMLGRPTVHDQVPWFWSDQYDNKMLIVGLSQNHDQQVTRGDSATRSFTVCYLKGGELIAVEAINHMKDYMAARRMIADRARPNLDQLANPAIALKDTL